MFNLLFPAEYPSNVLHAMVTRISNTELEDYSKQYSSNWMKKGVFNDYTVHFVARFSKSFKLFGGWKEKVLLNNIVRSAGSNDVGAFVDFDTKEGELIM